MAMEELGEQFDVHGGGVDLQFPHHENEIAQSEGATSKPFANYWMHVGLLQVNNEKMAKSTGNFLTIKDALQRYHPEVIKMFYMSSHYRSPLNFTDDALQQAHKSLQRFYQTIKTHSNLLKSDTVFDTEWVKRFEDAMNDDFNTAQALAILFELNNLINKTPDASMLSTFMYLANLLGILHSDANTFLQFSINEEQFTEKAIEMYIEKRKKARLDKDFSEADRIRQFLLEKGIELEDQVGVTSWRRRI
jgi:cysteinyl-tRNA synthetase